MAFVVDVMEETKEKDLNWTEGDLIPSLKISFSGRMDFKTHCSYQDALPYSQMEL